MNTEKLYRERFQGCLEMREYIWKLLCEVYFQKFVKDSDRLIDIGAGCCEFINNIKCKEKYALDFNEAIRRFASPDVRVIVADATDASSLPCAYFDKVFMSNFLEHLFSPEQLVQVMRMVYRILKVGGQVLILSPNILYVKEHFWDFLDHYIPLSHNTVKEVLHLTGFSVDLVVPRFLPYTTISRFPKNRFVIRAFLKLPVFWFLFGKQMFVVGTKK